MGRGVKVPAIERSHYTVYLEGFPIEGEGVLTFVHCDVHRWNKNIKRELMRDFTQLVKLRNTPLYCLRHDSKQEKFIKMFGFAFDFPTTDGQQPIDVYKLEI